MQDERYTVSKHGADQAIVAVWAEQSVAIFNWDYRNLLFSVMFKSLIDFSKEFIIIIIATRSVCMPILVLLTILLFWKAEPVYLGTSNQPFVLSVPCADNLVSPHLDMKDWIFNQIL
jgi:hypothetical protein